MRSRQQNNSDLNDILSKCMENCDMEWQCPTQTAVAAEVSEPQVTLIQLPNADLNSNQEIDLQYAFKLGANIKALVDNILNNASNVDVKPDNSFSYIFDNHQIVQEFINVSNTLNGLHTQINSIMDALNNQYINGQNTDNNSDSISDIQIITGDIQF